MRVKKYPGGTVDGHSIGLEQDEVGLFLVFDGVRIARRGDPETSDAGTWVSVVPGWRVGGTIEAIEIEHNGVRYQ